ncbi:hypothetical protein [Sphingomonas jaspsi]|uniref:hypothetical protein n=1 Tax=Sphingomonas jaspsi TaxID=392409 RepID=UPI0004B96B2C|nr:hypothetical protein [Sphingomonas jaspsi]
MKSIAFSTLAVSLLVAVPANAYAQDDKEQTEQVKPAKEDRKICKYLPRTGSRLEQRVCFTKKQWEQVEEASR